MHRSKGHECAVRGFDGTVACGRSLRAGFAASAAASGVEERRIAQQVRDRSALVRTPMRNGDVSVGQDRLGRALNRTDR
jgi:hypothetical protein